MATLIAEIGINHLGDNSKLQAMICELADAGVDACKLQYRSSTDFFAESLEMGSTLISQELDAVNLDLDSYIAAHTLAREKGIKIGVSFFRKADAEFYLEHVSPDFIKVPSAEALNFDLINSLLEKPFPILVSTGGLTWAQLKTLANRVKFRPEDCVMYCVANYPAKDGTANPKFLSDYSKLFDCKIGYSSHDTSWEMNIAMLATGAEYIERHYAQSYDDEGLDISTSSNLDEIKKLQYFCRFGVWASDAKIEDKIPNQGEIQNIKDLGSGYIFDADYLAGDEVDVSTLKISSPCRGIRAGNISGKIRLVRSASRGSALTESHLITTPKLMENYKGFLEELAVSLPIRFHDFKAIDEVFGIRDYEWHLSFREVEDLDKDFIRSNKCWMKEKRFSIHLPDYISANHLIDPFSSASVIREKSNFIVTKTTDFARNLQDLTGEEVPVVGSFSVLEVSRQQFYENYASLVDATFSRNEVKVLPQFLPKVAWYFGGSVLLDVFCDITDEKFMKFLPFGICLDTAHCIMAANYQSAEPDQWLRELSDIAGHFHISDATGVDGEGVAFGDGDLGSSLLDVLGYRGRKVIEQWEGHLNDFAGFKTAVNFLGACRS